MVISIVVRPEFQSERVRIWVDTLCLKCRKSYYRFLGESNFPRPACDADVEWDCNLDEEQDMLRPLDKAIQGNESEYEEEIELYRTYGGD
tara:strand:- start:658 stop:927 length:270 start_codon:yes stop_codon:yes gene_type:complete